MHKTGLAKKIYNTEDASFNSGFKPIWRDAILA